MILGVNLGYHSKKLYPLINDHSVYCPDEAFRFAVGSFIENVWFVLVYRQTKANMLTRNVGHHYTLANTNNVNKTCLTQLCASKHK